jgi:GDPmannose 4,6-dehydratase
MARIVVIGGSGQDGRILSQKLIDFGHQVLCLVKDRDSSRQVQGVRYVSLNQNFDDGFLSVIQEFQPNLVFNFASISSVATCTENPELSYETNFMLVKSIHTLLSVYVDSTGSKVKFIQAGSSEMYKPSNSTLNEKSFLEPSSIYGKHKKFAHDFLESKKGENHNLAISSLILFNHESYLRPENFVSQKIAIAASQLFTKKVTEIKFGDIQAARDWGCANDYMNAAISVGFSSSSENYVVASGKIVSITELLDHSLKYIDFDSDNYSFESDKKWIRRNDTPPLKGDSSKIQLHLGWKPTKTIFEVIEEMIDYQVGRSV